MGAITIENTGGQAISHVVLTFTDGTVLYSPNAKTDATNPYLAFNRLDPGGSYTTPQLTMFGNQIPQLIAASMCGSGGHGQTFTPAPLTTLTEGPMAGTQFGFRLTWQP